MKAIGIITGLFWATCVGVITMFAFFTATGGISPREVKWLTAVVGVLALLSVIHFVRVRRALDDHRHTELARRVHAMRETRGF